MPTTITAEKDADSVTLGLGVLGLCKLPSSPATYVDVGYIKAATFTYSREVKDFESAGLLVKRIVFRDRFTLRSEWAEVSLDNLAVVFQGATSGAPFSTIAFGGQRNIDRYAARFEHVRDDNKVITVDIFKCAPTGEYQLAFAEEEFIRYPVELAAEADSAKPTGQQYGKIKIAA